MEKHTVCIVGLGYVGLPLAYTIAKAGHTVFGYDVNEQRISELQSGTDVTGELTNTELQSVEIQYSTDPKIISEANIVVMAIPTPIDTNNQPDLSLLEAASETVGKHLKTGTIVVYESTVYPGVTEDICGDILERNSVKECGKEFFLGYSPERVNPGDKEHTVDKIVKVVAGQTEAITDTLCDFYSSFVTAGIHRAPSIKVAEMAKAIENAQRDLNIAFVNEVAILCSKLGISSKDVLDAAGTKWNFLPFTPGLVGGHCIGVDPYYLVEKARHLGMHTKVITAGRETNDDMGKFVAEQIHKHLGDSEKSVLVLGLTFKENVPDTRNAKSHDVIQALLQYGHEVEAHDATLTKAEIAGEYDAVALLVPHEQYMKDTAKIINLAKDGGVVYDLKSVLQKSDVEASGRTYVAL